MQASTPETSPPHTTLIVVEHMEEYLYPWCLY